jgi:hypothetical protein
MLCILGLGVMVSAALAMLLLALTVAKSGSLRAL